MDGRKIPGSARLTCGWALLSACAIAFGHYQLPCRQATSILRWRCDELTDTKAAYFSSLWIGTLCCAGSQATAAALLLLLPRRPRCVDFELACACLTVAVAGAGHFMYNGAIYILRPSGVYFAVVRLMFMVGDIICATALCLGGNSVCPRCRNELGHLRN